MSETQNSALTADLRRRIETARKYPLLREAAVTIELLTPLHIGAGDEGEISDAAVVLDANGLAAIPGSSIKGVLRSAFEREFGAENPGLARNVFGFQQRKNQKASPNEPDGQGARLRVTWGRVHNQHNQPVIGLLDPDAVKTDPVLASAAAPELRDHVRINGRGVSENKFDDLSVPAGHRFTFEIRFQSNNGPEDSLVWARLLALLRRAREHTGSLRFGGKTRRGFGAVKVIRLEARPDDTSVTLPPRGEALETVWLEPEEDCFWMFGGGDNISAENPREEKSENNEKKDTDSHPVRAAKIVWDSAHRGRVEPAVLVIPGSAVKGPLRHRTLYHTRRRLGVWAEDPDPAMLALSNLAVSLLFGDVSLDAPEDATPARQKPSERARAGCVFIDDLYLDGRDGAPPEPPQAPIQNHVTIDRALGGAFDHHLFNDQPLHGGGFSLRIHIEKPDSFRLSTRERGILTAAGLQDNTQALSDLFKAACDALDDALRDLKSGLLALGAHGSRGYGWFHEADSKPQNQTS